MRKTALDMVYQLALQDERIFFIGSDLGAGTLDCFQDEMPDRFFMEGIAEANVIGMAAGLAMEGYIVYVNTIAAFLTRRCLEQIALDLCLANLPVRLIGNGGGMVYAPLGPTHMAIDDIALMRALPNMTVIAPADAQEMTRLMPATVNHQGPIYLRLAKGYDPVVTSPDSPFAIGQAYPMRQGTDALIVTTGICLQSALEAADLLAADGIATGVLHTPTVKPFDVETFIQMATQTPVILTVEEHSTIGGLGSTVAEIVAETQWPSQKRFRRIGLPDVFPDGYGSQAELMSKYNIDTPSIIALIKSYRCEKKEKVHG